MEIHLLSVFIGVLLCLLWHYVKRRTQAEAQLTILRQLDQEAVGRSGSEIAEAVKEKISRMEKRQ
jgi:hypothetical protein